MIAVTSDEEELTADESLLVNCQGYVPPDLPDTGLFDHAAARIGLGVALVVLAFAYYKCGLFDRGFIYLSEMGDKLGYKMSDEGRRDSWEDRMIRKAEKKRRKGR